MKFSNSNSSSAVDEIISQAKDASVLEQISAINCSSFTDSLLPTDLETRFRKLNSLPINRTTPPPINLKARSFSTLTSTNSINPIMGHPQNPNFTPPIDNPQNPNFTPPMDNPLSDSVPSHGKNDPESKPQKGSFSPSGSSHTSEESSISSMFMPTLKDERRKSLNSENSRNSTNSSPPRKWGCFWCSPKKENKKKKKKEIKENVLGWDYKASDELLAGLGSLSSKKQEKIIKKAMKEEEQINREAEKIVEWAKHVSARMNFSDIEDELSDD